MAMDDRTGWNKAITEQSGQQQQGELLTVMEAQLRYVLTIDDYCARCGLDDPK